jgi:hypothetical protein
MLDTDQLLTPITTSELSQGSLYPRQVKNMASAEHATPVVVDQDNGPDMSEEAGSSPASSSSEDSSLNALSGDLKTDVRECLDHVESLGTFASFGTLEGFIDPHVYIDGRPISLPLSDDDAQRIIQASHKAPFGRGSETIVDASVRNTWEINCENFQLRNPGWQSYLNGILKKATEELGINPEWGSVKAELYKMLLYETGAMFKPHTE